MSSNSPRGAGWGRAALLLAGILCVVYVPMFLGKVIHYRDMAYWSYPVRSFIKHSLLSGQSPAWNPLQGLGLPVYADPLYGLHYPPNLLYLVLPLPYGITWVAFLHLVWGGMGMLVLGRRFGMSWVSGLIAALVWTLSGYNSSAWTAGLLLPAASWLPWCAVGFTRLVARSAEGWRGTVDGVVCSALPMSMSLLLGEVFYSMMAVGFGLVTAVVYAAVTPIRTANAAATSGGLGRARARLLAGVVVALALGALGGAVTYVPAAAVSDVTDRAKPLKRETAEVCSVPPRRVIETLAPGALGEVHENYPGYEWMRSKCVSKLPLVFSIYFGAGAAALALLALGRGRRLAGSLMVLLVLALLIAMGRHTPVHEVFRNVVKPFGYMRYPEKYLALVFGFLSLLSGVGAERLLTSPVQPWRRTLVLAGGLMAWAACARFVVAPQMGPFMEAGAMHGAIAAAVISGVQLLMRRGRRMAPGMLVAGVAIDLAVACWPLQGFGPASVATARVPGLELMLHDYGQRPVPPRLYRSRETDASVSRFVRVQAVQQGEYRAMQTLISEPLNAFGVAAVPAYDAAMSSSLTELWIAGKPVGQATMKLLAIDYAVMPVQDPAGPDHRSDLTRMLDPLPGARLYRVDDPLPRAYVAGSAVVVPDDKLLKQVFEPEVITGGRVLLAPDPAARPLPGAVDRPGECRIRSYRNDHVELTCDATRPALAVLVDQWSPGWSARVDGTPQPILRANGTDRAVVLTKGSHHISMSYLPPGVRLGRTLSACAALTLLGALVALRLAARGRTGAASSG